MKALNVDAGGYTPAIALLSMGRFGSFIMAFHSRPETPHAKGLLSYTGLEANAKTSPVWTSIATIAPLQSFSNSTANFCAPMSRVR